MQVGNRKLQGGRLPLLANLLPQLGADLLDDLFDAGWMDAAVGDQPVERHARDLASQRLESRDDDRLGSVVDDQVNARGRLQGPDASPLPSADPTLHVIGRKLDN